MNDSANDSLASGGVGGAVIGGDEYDIEIDDLMESEETKLLGDDQDRGRSRTGSCLAR